MKKTKIICTLGPNADKKEILAGLIRNGMDVARFNFSHGTHEEQKERLDLLKEMREELDVPVAALLDTKGPEIRTGLLQDGEAVFLEEGQNFTLTTEDVVGNAQLVSVNYPELAKDIDPGAHILIDDGLIELEVVGIDGKEMYCTVLNGGKLGQRKGVNVPNYKINLPALTEKDKEDILFGVEQGFDFIAASFVRNADAILEIRQLLEITGANMKIIAKIENQEGIENLDSIIEAADGIMVARGDLGVEIPVAKVPYVQKQIIEKCNRSGKVVITATQMLDSMIRNPRPTRAEVTDVANAVYDGTDAVMLSGETAMGKYPVEALKTMVNICEEAESHLDPEGFRNRRVTDKERYTISNAVCYSSVATAYDLEAKCIVAPSMGGKTVLGLSKYRSSIRVVGMSPDPKTVRQMQLLWGVTPILAKRAESTDIMIAMAADLVRQRGIVKTGDLTVFTAGVVGAGEGVAQHTNVMRVVRIL